MRPPAEQAGAPANPEVSVKDISSLAEGMGISILTDALTEVVESEAQRTDMGKQDGQRVARLSPSQTADGRLKESAGLLATQAHQLRPAGDEQLTARRHAARAADLLRAAERQRQCAKMGIETLRGQLQF